MFILGPISVGPATEYTARLDVEIDSAQQGLKKKCWIILTANFWFIALELKLTYVCSWQFSFQFIFSLSVFYFRLYPLVHLRAVFLYFYAHILLIMTIGLTISSIALKAIEGIVRLHTPHKLQVCVQPLNI